MILCCGPADSPQGASFLKSLPWRNLGRKQESGPSGQVRGTGTCVGGRGLGPSFSALLIKETCWGKKEKDNSADRKLWGCENGRHVGYRS